MKFKRIYFVNAGEPLPIEGNKPHRMSHWMTKLSQKGYDISFITTDFEHQRKIWITQKKIPKGYHLLKSRFGYKKNVSIKRLANHYFLGKSLKKMLLNLEKPDLIVCSYPTIYMSYIATIYGKKNDIPVLVDVRDLWPDIFINPIIGRFLLFPLYIQKNFIFSNATIIAGVSPRYVEWATSDSSSMLNVLPLTQYSPIPKGREVLNSRNPLKLIFVGTLGDTYDLDLINKISESLTLSQINHEIVVCGDGPKKEAFLKATELIPQVIFLGWLKKKDLDLVLKSSHIGLMLYKDTSPQGWPNKLIEYMSFGLPVVNSLPGESWKLIREERVGINIEHGNLEPMISWIKKEVIPNYQHNSEQTLKVFKEFFDEETTFNKLLKIIDDVTTNS